jgi:hypothetical protein
MAEVKLSDIIKVGDVIRHKNSPMYNKNFIFKVLEICSEEMLPGILTSRVYASFSMLGYINFSVLDEDFELVKEIENEKEIVEWLK